MDFQALIGAIFSFRAMHLQDPDIILLSFNDYRDVYESGVFRNKVFNTDRPFQFGRIEIHSSLTMKDNEPLFLIKPKFSFHEQIASHDQKEPPGQIPAPGGC